MNGFLTLEQINAAVVRCDRCARLRAYCRAIAAPRKREFQGWDYWGRPVPSLGDPRARLLIVGLAPAAHGANRTGRMFTGDSSGNWLYDALHRSGFATQAQATHRGDGLELVDCYITAAVRCAPPDNKPTPAEFEQCRSYMKEEIRLLERVAVVVVLGRIAHDSWLKAAGWWAKLQPRERPRFAHGAEMRLPDGTILIASYHPSRQNTNTGKLTRPMWLAVFQAARARLDDRLSAFRVDSVPGGAPVRLSHSPPARGAGPT